MSSTHLSSPIPLSLILIGLSVLVGRSLQTRLIKENTDRLGPIADATKVSAQVVQSLKAALPNRVLVPEDTLKFKLWRSSYHAQQESEVTPACVIQPCNAAEVSTAIKIIKHEFDARNNDNSEQGEKAIAGGLFAVRSGGHAHVAGAASLQGGVVIDMSSLNEVTPSADGTSVVIGAGARWGHVYNILEQRGLAVVGGRASDVGVGGFTLGGGLSFFGPCFGFSCSNVIEYEIVLADGSVTMASASNDSDLWRALKGGANNYGVVSRITVRSFPCSPRIWGGFLYLPAFQSAKVLEAFHDFLNRQPSRNNGYDEYAAGPLTCFTYFQPLGFEIICASIAYTKIPDDKKRWPKCWGTSGFKPLWRYWSTCGVRTLTSLSVEMNSMDPAGRRQAGANVTVKNDLGTLFALHKIFQETISSVTRIRGMTWTLVLQPLPPNKGDPNPLGLDFEESMVIVSLSVHWVDAKDDELARATTRSTMEKFEALIDANKTGHRYRYLNYSAAWQDPFKGYGEANLKFLQDVSRKYDPEGLFQKGCVGGFKLNVGEHAEKKSIVT